jgi:hypothetical protein
VLRKEAKEAGNTDLWELLVLGSWVGMEDGGGVPYGLRICQRSSQPYCSLVRHLCPGSRTRRQNLCDELACYEVI